MMEQRHLTLFVFCNATSYKLQRYIFERALGEGRRVALLFTGASGLFFSEVLQDASRLEIQAFALDDEIDLSTESPPWWPARNLIGFRAIATTLLLPFISKFHRVRGVRKAWAKRLAVTIRLMRRVGVSAVVCSEDGISSDLAVLAAARSICAPVVDIPFGNGTRHELEVDLGRKREEGRLIIAGGRDRALLKLLAPQWLKKGLYEGAIMYPPEMIMALESLGVTLRDAWIIHGGNSDILCVENEMSLQQYTTEGIPAAKLRLTGSPYCDAIVGALRDDSASTAALRLPQRIEAGRTRILVSWPPSYHETYPGSSEFATYEEMTITVFTFLKQLPKVQLTVSLHPACSEGVADVLQKLGVDIASEYVLNLIPTHDVFVTYFSSTIRWALAAGKVVVNYDAYKIKLKTFDPAPGFLSSESFDRFRAQVVSLVDSDVALAETMSRQIQVADDWGILDGQSTGRIFHEIDKVVASCT